MYCSARRSDPEISFDEARRKADESLLTFPLEEAMLLNVSFRRHEVPHAEDVTAFVLLVDWLSNYLKAVKGNQSFDLMLKDLVLRQVVALGTIGMPLDGDGEHATLVLQAIAPQEVMREETHVSLQLDFATHIRHAIIPRGIESANLEP